MKKIDGKYINDLKSFRLLPFITDLEYQYNLDSNQNKFDFVQDAFIKLENILNEDTLPDETFKDLNVKYRKLIEEKFLNRPK